MLRCVSSYVAGSVRFEVGELVDDARLEAHLLIDSPESFQRVSLSPVITAFESPPVDRQVKRGRTRKDEAE